MQIKKLMTNDVETCHPEDSLHEALGKMWKRDVGCLPVIDSDRRVVGMITDRDCAICCYTQGQGPRDLRVSQAMAAQIASCAADEDVRDVESRMSDAQVRRMPVVDQNRQLIGIVSLNDLARATAGRMDKKNGEVPVDQFTRTMASICRPRSEVRATTA